MHMYGISYNIICRIAGLLQIW